MSAIKIAENVYWVGSVDYDIREFHGYLTPFGTSYNAYLVIDEKITLIDSVKAPFYETMVENIREIVPVEKIDYIISNHVEPDHSGSIGKVAAIAKDAIVFTSVNGEKGLKAYYGEGWNLKAVKSGERICSGKYSYTFLHTPMVHWPDNMVTYMQEQNILFSNDAFGQHIARACIFTDEIDQEVIFERAKDYYANIVLPFGAPVERVLQEASKLKIDIIAPSHGLVWRRDLVKIIEKYAAWAQNKTDEAKAVIVFDTMWDSTKMLAQQLFEELKRSGITAKIMNVREYHISQIMAELIDAKYIYVGSPTLNRNMMPTIAGFLCYMKGLAPKKRIGRAFGSYGWSGESIPQIEAVLKECGFEMQESIKAWYRPSITL